ncbi:MAG: bifunctional oligoribonuclease/PAP phosphatase NrnA [Deltaproteobacteria bacterium]|nr:bifunctional oligoribonuclease/PAP phosphatase NrnA [Deltaproteobacteria bacterium]
MSHAHELLAALEGRDRVLLTGPTGPDGDSLGACLAFQRVLAARGIQASVAGVVPRRYRWMPGIDTVIPDPRVTGRWPAVVVMDGDRHRLTPQVGKAFAEADFRGIVDHHSSTRPDGYEVAWIEPQTGSACEMLHAALPDWQVALDRDLATLLYTGIVFDTGGFRHANTTPQTLRVAASLLELGVDHAGIVSRILHERTEPGLRLSGTIYSGLDRRCGGALAIGRATHVELAGVADGDLEGVPENLLQVENVEVSALLLQRDDEVKYSLRSRGLVDVAKVAAALAPTGGGHPRAAGAIVRDHLDGAADRLEAVVSRALAGA